MANAQIRTDLLYLAPFRRLDRKKLKLPEKFLPNIFFTKRFFRPRQFFFEFYKKIFEHHVGVKNAKNPSKFLPPITQEPIFRYQCYFAGDTSLPQCLVHESYLFSICCLPDRITKFRCPDLTLQR